MMYHLTITPEKISIIHQGHPWVYPKAILDKKIPCKTGELVTLVSPQKAIIGIGVYNEHSLYRVRVLARSFELSHADTLEQLIQYRLATAWMLRKRLNLPNSETTAFRLFNSEADGLSGLTIDVFGEIAVIASSAYWVEQNRALIEACVLASHPGMTCLWVPQKKALKQDGWEVVQEAQTANKTVVSEAGVLFQIDFSTAQKTGLYLDQRENHQRLAHYTKGARVLDLYTYSGGFALHAAKAGAAYVLAVDSSEPAIARAKENAVLNDLTQIEWAVADARDYLSRAGEFDVIILDPPKLAPSKKNQQAAKNYYRFLHQTLFQVMRPGTLLMTCNCSSALNTEMFVGLIHASATKAKRQFRVNGVFGPAVCHPTLPSFPEGQYLSAVLGVLV